VEGRAFEGGGFGEGLLLGHETLKFKL